MTLKEDVYASGMFEVDFYYSAEFKLFSMGEGGSSALTSLTGALASDIPEPPGAVMIVTPPISFSLICEEGT